MTFTILVPAVKFGIAVIAVHDIVISFITMYISLIQQSAVDLGGPRKEFFALVLREIKDTYFNPVKEWSPSSYEVVGKVLGLYILLVHPIHSSDLLLWVGVRHRASSVSIFFSRTT